MLSADPEASLYNHPQAPQAPALLPQPPVTVVSSFPLGEIIQNREVAGRIAKWSVELMSEALTYVPLKAIKSQVLVDFITEWTDAQLPPVQVQAEL